MHNEYLRGQKKLLDAFSKIGKRNFVSILALKCSSDMGSQGQEQVLKDTS